MLAHPRTVSRQIVKLLFLILSMFICTSKTAISTIFSNSLRYELCYFPCLGDSRLGLESLSIYGPHNVIEWPSFPLVSNDYSQTLFVSCRSDSISCVDRCIFVHTMVQSPYIINIFETVPPSSLPAIRLFGLPHYTPSDTVLGNVRNSLRRPLHKTIICTGE